jgi:hypothetical protein
LEQKQIQLNLDLELAQNNLQKAKDDAAGKESLSTGSLAIFSPPFSDSNVILSRNNETGFGEEGP